MGRRPIHVLVISLVAGSLTLGCSAEKRSSTADTDMGSVRAKLSVCTGLALHEAVAYSLAAAGSELGRVRSCVSAAESCDEVVRCVDSGPATAPPAAYGVGACQPGTLDACKGETFIYCLNGMEMHEDCSLTGRICRSLQNGTQYACLYPTPCAAAFCDGNVAVDCLGGFEYGREDCTTSVPDGRCIVGSNHDAGCITSSPSAGCIASEFSSSSCENGLGVACIAHARVTTDCAAFQGAHCVADGSSSAARCEL